MFDANEKPREFLLIVQTLATVTFAKGDHDFLRLAGVMASAIDASRRLPADRGALICALEFAGACLPGFEADDRAEWLATNAWDPEAEPTEELIDGCWRPVNPRWIGLPGDGAANLEILAILRDNPGRTLADLVAASAGTAASIRARMPRLERDGLIVRSTSEPCAWSLADPLPG